MIELSNIRIEKANSAVKLVCDLRSDSFAEKTMWFSAPERYGDIFTDEVYDAFLAVILYPAMYYREDIVVRGAVSKKLLKNISTYVKKVLLAFSSDLADISVTAGGYGTVTKSDSLVGTGFSAGVDSFATFVEHYVNEDDADYKINALFFFNVGSHGRFDSPDTAEKFKNRYEYCRKFPDDLHIPFIPVDSNVHAFHKEFGHQKTHPLTLASGVLSVQRTVGRYYISSAISYAEMENAIHTAHNFSLGEFAEPYLYPLLSPDGLEIIPDGEQYLRTEKTRLLADYEPAQKFLNVCVKGDDGYVSAENCSCCPKCLRTLMALDSMDKLQDFSGVFNIATYRKNAFKYKCRQRLLYAKDPFAKDNVDFARKNGKSVPPFAVALVVCLPARIRALAVSSAKALLGENTARKVKAWLKAKRAKNNGGGTSE